MKANRALRIGLIDYDRRQGWHGASSKVELKGNEAPEHSTETKPALSYLAPGTRNFFARSSWDASATWSVFTSAPRLGPDHQHLDDSNFVVEHGADTLIADPSPYGSLSSLSALTGISRSE